MKKIIISKQDVEKIVAYAREKLPNEACGLIAGTENEEEKCIENTKLCRREETKNGGYGRWWIYRT